MQRYYLRKIVENEPSDSNLLNRQAHQVNLYYSKSTISVGVRNTQVYTRAKSVSKEMIIPAVINESLYVPP